MTTDNPNFDQYFVHFCCPPKGKSNQSFTTYENLQILVQKAEINSSLEDTIASKNCFHILILSRKKQSSKTQYTSCASRSCISLESLKSTLTHGALIASNNPTWPFIVLLHGTKYLKVKEL